MRRFAAAGLSLAVAAGVLVVGTVLATSNATAATCTGTLQINSMTFDPPTVKPGQSSTVTAVVQNCTSQDVAAQVQWYARFVDGSGSIPPGCIVYDPLIKQLTVPANGVANAAMTYSTFAGCTSSGLQATASISAGGATLASQSATLITSSTSASPSSSASASASASASSSASASASASPSKPPAPCAVAYTRTSEWSGGVVAQVTITNTGTASISGWTLTFTFPGDQKITNAWNTTATQTGAAVSAKNLNYNGVIAPGASTSFGFQATWHTSDANPTAFALNGATCTTR
jgi:hypothetical protein